MHVKTYRGSSSRTVLERIKVELGPEAVILSTRNFREQGEPLCEVTAAVENMPAPRPAAAPQKPRQASPAQADPLAAARAAMRSMKRAADGSIVRVAEPEGPGVIPADTMARHAVSGSGFPKPAGHDGTTPEMMGWEQEWSAIKHHLCHFLKPQLDRSCLTPRQRVALEHLETQGVEDTVLMEIYRMLKENGGASVLEPLDALTPVKAWCPENWPETFHALAGPCGSGKTSCLIRMALELRRAAPDTRICLASVDQRGAGRHLLKQYAELCNMDYMDIPEPASFARLVRNKDVFDKVFVDLPPLGRDQTLEGMAEDSGLQVAEDLRIHIVYSPYYTPGQFRAFTQQYYSPRAGSLIWTKLDEAYEFGALVNLAVATRLPVSAFSHGQGLRGTLTPAQSLDMWRMVFKQQLPTNADTDQ